MVLDDGWRLVGQGPDVAHRRADHPERGEHHPDRADGQRLTESDPNAERATGQTASHCRATGDGADRRVDAPLEVVRDETLAKAAGTDAVDGEGAVLHELRQREHRDRDRRHDHGGGNQEAGYGEDDLGPDDRPSEAEAAIEPLRDDRADDRADAAAGEDQADHRGAKVERAGHEEDVDGHEHPAEEGRGAGAAGRRPEQGIASDDVEPLGNIAQNGCGAGRAVIESVGYRGWCHARSADPHDEERRDREGQRVEADREWRADPTRDRAGEGRSGGLGGGVARLELAVRVAEVAAGNQRR